MTKRTLITDDDRELCEEMAEENLSSLINGESLVEKSQKKAESTNSRFIKYRLYYN